LSKQLRTKPISDQISIVLIGSFNPAIFHPTWLALKKLIPEETTAGANLQVVHPEISQFLVADMLFQIQASRFLIQCDAAYAQIIRDLALSIFQDFLPETPIWTMGINRRIEFSCGSEEARDRLGQMLAPVAAWGEWGKQVVHREASSEMHGGMTRVVMKQQPRPDKLKGHIQADVQPSTTDRSAVLLDINNHFEISEQTEKSGSGKAMDVLNIHWQDATAFAAYIANELMLTVERIA
jgi:hypothetical protein